MGSFDLVTCNLPQTSRQGKAEVPPRLYVFAACSLGIWIPYRAGVESTGLRSCGFAARSAGLRPPLTLVCSTVASAILTPLRKTDQRRANRIPCTVSHSVVTVSLGIGAPDPPARSR